MRVKEYVSNKKCSKSGVFRFMETTDESPLLMANLMTSICSIVAKVSKKKPTTSEVLEEVEELFLEELENILKQFKAEWVGGSENQLMEKRNLVRALFARFNGWFFDYLQDCEVVSFNENVSLWVAEDDGTQVNLEETAHLIAKKQGGYVALVLNVGKNYEKRSMNGRSSSTRIESDLRYAVLKTALESRYPGINIVAVFLQEGETKGQLNPWLVNGTQKSNVFIMPFLGCYEDGVLDEGLCLSNAENALNEYMNKGQTDKCNNCMHKADCQMQKYSERKISDGSAKKEWQFPQYDSAQKEFVDFKEGEVLVLAGPGAGKTSATIGRVESLRQSGVPTERMLLISYTEKAAGELVDRLYGKYPEDEMPRIGTLHSVAREIITLWERMKKVDKKESKKLLTQSVEKRIVKNVLENFPQLDGVDYRNFISGRFNTVYVVYEGLKKYRKDAEAFFSRYKDYEPSQWVELAKAIDLVIREENYISYDEQIRLASEILKSETAVRQYLNSQYSYVMVDEYQDINSEQEELIGLLNSGNLACIGDDDQAIYGFRGCSSRYMQEFMQRHPNASLVKFVKNYRSTRSIVEFSNSILERMSDEQRIAKMVEYAEYAQEGVSPVLVNGNEVGQVQDVIDGMLKKGYSYGDMAIISTKNDNLNVLNDSLSAPTELASAFLVNDFLFHVVTHTLGVALEEDSSLNSYNRLGLIFEREEKWFEELKRLRKEPEDGFVSEVISFARKLVSANETPGHYVARLSAFLDMDGSVSEESVLSLVRSSGVDDLQQMYQLLSDMLLFGDDKKLEYPIEDKITLITSHSCKGKEWPVVILYDTDAFCGEIAAENESSMDLRLFYVASTRAREQLVLMKAYNSVSIVDESILVKRAS